MAVLRADETISGSYFCLLRSEYQLDCHNRGPERDDMKCDCVFNKYIYMKGE